MNIVRKHPYIITIVTSTFLAVVVWMLVPKHYTAQTTLSDEYKETDLVVGLNNINVFIRNATGAEDLGVNNVEVYAKILKSYDFAQKIANIKIPAKGIKYADYLNEEDTLKEIRDRISYNVRTKKSTLTIAFTDKDPLVASQMLDSITAFLQSEITTARRKMSAAALKFFRGAKVCRYSLQKKLKLNMLRMLIHTLIQNLTRKKAKRELCKTNYQNAISVTAQLQKSAHDMTCY